MKNIASYIQNNFKCIKSVHRLHELNKSVLTSIVFELSNGIEIYFGDKIERHGVGNLLDIEMTSVKMMKFPSYDPQEYEVEFIIDENKKHTVIVVCDTAAIIRKFFKGYWFTIAEDNSGELVRQEYTVEKINDPSFSPECKETPCDDDLPF